MELSLKCKNEMKREAESLFIVEVLLAAQATVPDKSPWDSNVIFIFFRQFSVPS